MGIVDVDMGIRALLVVLPLIGTFFFVICLFSLKENLTQTNHHMNQRARISKVRLNVATGQRFSI